MHELSVALSLLEGVTEAASAQGAERVTAVHVRIGALSGVARDALEFCWELAVADSIASGSRLHVHDVPLAVFCERCASEGQPPPGAGLVCPECRTPCGRIVHGRELQLVALEVPA